jgi:hypothetical protein
LHFGPHESVIGRIILVVEDHIVAHCKSSVMGTLGFHPTVVTRERLELYSDRIRASGQPAAVWQRLCGFLDGCHHCISRPSGNSAFQRAFYSGYVRGHAVSYHFITGADGLILNVFGPLQGRYNDLNVLSMSRLQEVMEANPGKLRILGVESCVFAAVTARYSFCVCVLCRSVLHRGW